VSTPVGIESIRSRAAYYRHEVARVRERARLIYCRALASYLEREAIELERAGRSGAIQKPSQRSDAAE